MEADLLQSEGSSCEALGAEVLCNGVQVEHRLMDLINGVHGVHGGQFLSSEHLFRGLDHGLGMVVTQLHAGADDRAAKPLAQDLWGGVRPSGTSEETKKKTASQFQLHPSTCFKGRTFPCGVIVQMTEKVSLSVRGLRLHSSSHSSRGNMGITLTRQNT